MSILQLRLRQSMRCSIVSIAFASSIGLLAAGEADSVWIDDDFEADLTDTASLQRGAALYTNFCLGCHSLQYQRYERVATDLGNIPEDVMLENLIWTGQKVGEHMESAMSEEDAKKWFGAAPPDLTMVTRVRSPEWVYSFLTTFYVDESRPFGVNNKVFENVGMPHVLLPLQGIPNEVCEGRQPIDMVALNPRATVPEDEVPGAYGRDENCYDIEVQPGTGVYDEAEFKQAAMDLATFLHYVSDPSRLERESLGVWVIGFLLILLVLAIFLNREYWKDIPKSPKRKTEHEFVS